MLTYENKEITEEEIIEKCKRWYWLGYEVRKLEEQKEKTEGEHRRL